MKAVASARHQALVAYLRAVAVDPRVRDAGWDPARAVAAVVACVREDLSAMGVLAGGLAAVAEERFAAHAANTAADYAARGAKHVVDAVGAALRDALRDDGRGPPPRGRR